MLSQQQELSGLLSIGWEEARQNATRILVSQVTKIHCESPLSFYKAGEAAYNGERMYWSAPNEEVTLVGLGLACTIERYQGNIYTEANERWEQILKHCIMDQEVAIPATGPVLMGGFSFDPLKKKAHMWRDFPDTMFMLPKFMLTVIDGQSWLTTNIMIQPEQEIYEVTHVLEKEREAIIEASSYPLPSPTERMNYMQQEVDPLPWMSKVEQIAREIRSGQSGLDKVVLAREIRLHLSQEPAREQVLQQLHMQQPDSYIFAVESGEHCFLGASPERLIKRQGLELEATCMAGSIRRGKTAAEDLLLGQELLADQKNIYEHQVVVDMIYAALEKVCQYVDPPSQLGLYKTRDIQHLHTVIKAIARPDFSLFNIIEQLSPTPALGGFPKLAALSKIREVESFNRGWYAAPVGWMNAHGDGEFAVGIRSCLIKGQQAYLFAGCGIVADSDPKSEYEETSIKFQPMLSALKG